MGFLRHKEPILTKRHKGLGHKDIFSGQKDIKNFRHKDIFGRT